MPAPKMSARRAAIALLDQVLGERRLLSDLLGGRELEALAPADRARAQRLATETLRGLERVDRLLHRHVRRHPPLTVRNALRLATYELCQGGEAHGIVSEIVTLVSEDRRTLRFKGLVNAVLRQIAEKDAKAWKDLRIPRLPDWLRRPLLKTYGAGAVNAMEKAHFAGAPLDLSARGEAAEWAQRLGGELLPGGSVRLQEPGQVSALPGYAEGAWWVQDAAAALPVRLLDPQPGEQVLDLCAAPGGKTLQLASSGAKVTALDLSPERMRRVAENLTRTGLTAELVTLDARDHQGGPYDAILLDAPCSATGTIRRHPDLPHIKDGKDLDQLVTLQAEMLDHALRLLKPDGRLVFCTCSLLPEEGEQQTINARARHAGLRISAYLPEGIPEDWRSDVGGIRLRPDYWAEQGGMDGFYMVRFDFAPL